MACVQGTWWGVDGGVVGGWWGSWLWCLVSGWGWVLGLGCLVGGGVWLAGPGSWSAGGVARGGPFPLDPSLTPAPPAWWAVGLGSGRPSIGGWWLLIGGRLVGCSSFLMGWAGLVGGLSCGLRSGWVVLNLGSWLRFSLVGEVRPCVCWGCSRVAGFAGCVLCRGVVLNLAVLFPLGGPTWTVGLFAAPLFLPPQYTMDLPRPPNPVGELTR